jgi:sigma-B regulation protein RsbU (phosphoserine phosphatase)
MSDRIREADFELKYRVWELESLYDVGLSITRTLDLDALAEDVLMKSVSLLNARKGTLIVRDAAGDGKVLVKEFGGLLFDGGPDDLEDRFLQSAVSSKSGAYAASTGEKLLAVSINSDERKLGVLVVSDKENRAGGVEDWSESDKRILSLFANQAAIALENARLHREALEKERMEREIELAASIQKTILPVTLPDVCGLILAGGNRPTRQVGGDYFDVYPLADGRTAFCVADVSGKGVPAALLVSTVHACLHLLVGELASNLPALVARTNKHLRFFSSARKFVTMFFAVYDPAKGELNYVNAGHNPGLLFREGGGGHGEVVELPSGGRPVGMFDESTYIDATVPLSTGDLLVLYSDGITEAVNAADEEFGTERLVSLVNDARMEAPAELSQRVFSAVGEFTRGVAQYDDQTVLVARVA